MQGSNYCLFLDRDGTINHERHFIKDPNELHLIPGAAETIRETRALGAKVIVVSNQSGVGRGILTEEDVRRVNERLLALLQQAGTTIDAIYYCPHYSENGDVCTCRKPNPGMFEQARDEHDVDLSRSIMVGDRLSDMQAGRRIGAATVLVLTGYGKTLKESWETQPDVIDIVVSSIYESMPFIQNKISEWNRKTSGVKRGG
jgi:histidinol-phosphate phosphatase family protein